MLPTRDKLDEIARLREGRFDQVPFAVLTLALAVNERTVLLEMRRDPLEKKIVFDAGVPVDCHSNVATETIGRFMMATGRLSESDFRLALSTAASRGVPIEDILVEKELVKPFDLYRILQQNLARKLLDGFTWRSGTFRLSNDVPLVDAPLKVRVPQLLLTGISKFGNSDEIRTEMGELAGKPLALSPEPFFPLDELRLSGEQTKILEEVRSRKPLEAIAFGGAFPADEAIRFLYALALLGLVTTADKVPVSARFALDLSGLEPEERPWVPGTPAPRAPTPPPNLIPTPPPSLTPLPGTLRRPPTQETPYPDSRRPTLETPLPGAATVTPKRDPAQVAKLRDDLVKTFMSYRRKDALEFFALSEDASQRSVNDAYLKFIDRFAENRFDGEASELRERAQELLVAAARAYADLSDADRRRAILMRRRAPREEAKKSSGIAGDRLRLKTDLLDPEVQYQDGKALMEEGKFRDALTYLEFAANCDAQNGTYASEMAWCRFKIFGNANQSLALLKEAMRFDPKCGLAWYYTGKIHESGGNVVEAERFYRQAAKLMEDDQRAKDALKALS